MTRWLHQHARALGHALARFARTPLATLFNVGVIGVAIALPVAFHVALTNVQQFARGWTVTPQLSVFLRLDAPRSQANEIEKRLLQHADVSRARFVPREQALQELKAGTGIADIIDSLGQNPLPDAFVIDARDTTPEKLEALRDALRAWPGVAHVQLDSAWARRLTAVLSLGRVAVLMLAGLLAFALVAVIFNTIRLQILTQRDEIEVAKLIGATDGFIRRPFLYYGSLLGLAGAGAGWLIVGAALYALAPGLGELGALYGTSIDPRHLDRNDALTLLGFSAWLGWLGAWLSVARHLVAGPSR